MLNKLAICQKHCAQVWSVCWSPTHLTLASTGTDKSIRIWKPTNMSSTEWSLLSTIPDAHQRTIRAISFSPDGRVLASASFDGSTAIWARSEEQGDFEAVTTLEGHENEVKSVAWSPSGQFLVTCGRDKSVWIWEATEDGDFECVSVLQEHTQDVKMVTFSPVQDVLLSVSYDNDIKIWKEEDDDWYCKHTLSGHESTVWSADFNRDGTMIASVGQDQTLRIWREEAVNTSNSISLFSGWSMKETKWTLVCTAKVHSRAIYSCSWSKVNDLILTAGSDNCIKVHKFENNQLTTIETINEPHGKHDVNCVQWCPLEQHKNLFASGGDDENVFIWSLNSAI